MTLFPGKAAKVLVLSALTALALAVSAMAAEGEYAIGAGVTTGSSLRLRSEPSTSCSILTMLDKGVTLAVLDRSTPGWYKVSYAGRTGYVSADYLALDEDNVFETYGRVNGDTVNVRSAASVEAESLGTLVKNSTVTVNGLLDGWYDVTCESGTRGYIRSDFVDLVSSAVSANGSAVVALAQQHLGVPYVWGGASSREFQEFHIDGEGGLGWLPGQAGEAEEPQQEEMQAQGDNDPHAAVGVLGLSLSGGFLHNGVM